jgi:tetratricopeptide (TPR) repeat protein
MYQFKKEALQEAIELFRNAAALDAQFASPFAAEAFAYGVRQTFGWGDVTPEERVKVQTLARRAAELDKDDAVALTYAGYALVLLCHELDDGAEFLKRAINSNPNLAIAWTYLGYCSTHLGHHRDAIEHFKRAIRLSPLDPLDFATQNGLSQTLFFADEHSEGLRWALSAVRANPNWASARISAMMNRALLGDIEAAKADGEVAMQLDPARRLSTVSQRYPLRRDEDREKLAKAYRLGGIPE